MKKAPQPPISSSEPLFDQSLLDALPLPAFYKNRDGIYIGCNAALEALLNKSRGEILGKTVFELSPERAPICHSRDQELFATGEPCQYESCMQSPDGQEKAIVFSKNPLRREGDIVGILGTVHDISDLRHTQRTLEQTLDFWKMVLDNMRDAVSIVDARNFDIVGANKVFRQMFNNGEEILRRNCHSLHFDGQSLSPQKKDTCRCPLGKTLEQDGPVLIEHQVPAEGGGQKWLEISTSPIRDEEGRIRQIVVVSRDITERKKSQERIQNLCYFDALTSLPNRALLIDRLDQLIHQSRKKDGHLAVIWMDLDHFKRINDNFGYAAGDQILQTLARRLKDQLRRSDTLARLDGDAFVLALPSVRNEGDVLSALRSIQRRMGEPFTLEGKEIFLTFSCGIALHPQDGHSAAELIRNAEMAAREVKGQGRNHYLFFSSDMNQVAKDRLRMEIDLRQALRVREFLLHFQPQVETATGAVTGVEALVRWQHPSQGLISPHLFIPPAEESGLIVDLGEWVLREACRQAVEWQGLFPDLRMAVNLSARQLHAIDPVQQVKAILTETGLDPRRLELELTESLLLEDSDAVRQTLYRLKDLGITIAIDDFGTGYSSLSYLHQFPLDRLKIAQNFTRNLLTCPNHVAIVKAILGMARALEMEVVAEGVETQEQRDLLADLQCEIIQGFFYARPMPPFEVEKFCTGETRVVGVA